MNPIIEVENLSKRFRLSADRPSDLREALVGRVRKKSPDPSREFWALQDISFAVEPGNAMGIVGHNGSGKSTMLKILTGMMKPTSGAIRTRGRIGALIEVGAGFHMDLSGRENVFLNGSILGLSRREIARKFDAIVDFAGLEQFIDTPVKRYSSGMYMRLGFAIAAHIDPDILIVDEVLAVGDTQFRRKCMARMKEFVHNGGTILFVSHAMAEVAELCERCVWLDHGRILHDGPTQEAIDRYMTLVVEREDEEFKRHHPEEWAERRRQEEEAERQRQEEEALQQRAAEEREREESERRRAEEAERSRMVMEQVWPDPATAPGNETVRLHRACGRPEAGRPGDPLTVRTPIALEFSYWNHKPGARLNLSLQLFDESDTLVFATYPGQEPRWHGRPLPVGLFHSVCHIPGDLLNDGLYRVQLLVVESAAAVMVIHDEPSILKFQVQDAPDLRGEWDGDWPGLIRPNLIWSTELVEQGPGPETAHRMERATTAAGTGRKGR